MNQDPVYSRLRELSWRRPLTDSEQAELRAWLVSHPEAHAEWDADAELSAVLTQMPDAPVPSNFTARVLHAVERETNAGERERAPRWSWWRLFLPRAAAAVVAVGLGLFAYQRHEVTQRARLAKELVETMPAPEALENFDTIRRLNPRIGADEELLALNEELLALKQ